MTICDACHESEVHGRSIAPSLACAECMCRNIAHRWAEGKVDAKHVELACQGLYGAKWEEAHEAVKVMYRRIKGRHASRGKD